MTFDDLAKTFFLMVPNATECCVTDANGKVLATFKRMEVMDVSEEVFAAILNSSDGDYAMQALVLSNMKPSGW